MPGSLSLTVGQATVSVSINLTNTQIRAVLRRYAIIKGIPVEGRTDAEIVEDVLRSLKRHVADHSLDRHRSELIDEQRATIEAIITADNDF